MLVDMSDVIDDCSVCIVVTRYTAPVISYGRKTGQPESSQFEISASVTPLPSKERELLPEGIKAKGGKFVISPERLYTARVDESIPADEFDYQGTTYLIHSEADWYDLGRFYAYVAIRRDR